ncbi:MAG TPA: stage II sporulation protein M [Isosphaeraceae bacterium]|jgi:uncharacterized membrane protein SpoIIM required for sporulation|nr:stage II sporulation protein M [Isosphaeraceae bacterium]
MRVVDRLARREDSWKELDRFLRRMEGTATPPPMTPRAPAKPEVVWLDDRARPEARRPEPTRMPRGKLTAEEVLRVGELYRAACADLMLAEAYDLPRDTVAYLHDLVARAHNAVYRGRGFRFRTWAKAMLAEVPRRLRADKALRVAAVAFWGPFLVAMMLAAARPEFAEKVAGPAMLEQMEHDHSVPMDRRGDHPFEAAAGFYIQHNASIGLSCFAWGLSFGLVTLYMLVSNGLTIGTVFGHMTRTPSWTNFYQFVTAHGPFELTGIVFAGAAGLRIGYGLIDTKGQTRLASLRREAIGALPTVGVSVVLFVLAAFLEGFVSPSALPYAAKAGIAGGSALLLILYLALGGRRTAPDESDSFPSPAPRGGERGEDRRLGTPTESRE